MQTLAEIESLLSIDSLPLPPGVDVKEIRVTPYVDWDGEDALYVLIVLADGTRIPLPKGWSPTTKLLIHDTLLQHGCKLYPYTHYALEGELEESTGK